MSHPTPMMKQYYELREQAKDAILFFRMGDFYELFGEDAQRVAPVLDIVLTSREKEKDGDRIPFCGVPHHSVKSYIERLLGLGYKVAIADQLESPSEAKGIVKRGIVRTLTPGCPDEFEVGQDSVLLAAYFVDPGSKTHVFALLDHSVGELRLGVLRDESDLLQHLLKFRPRELLVRRFYLEKMRRSLAETVLQSSLSLSELPEAPLREGRDQEHALSELIISGGKIALFDKHPPCKALTAAVLQYVRDLGLSTAHVGKAIELHPPTSMILDGTVIRDLELFETNRRREVEGSFFAVVDQTCTTMGRRLIKNWILQPLIEVQKIRERQDRVEVLFTLPDSTWAPLRDSLRQIPDLQRAAARLQNRSSRPQDLGRLIQGLNATEKVQGLLESLPSQQRKLWYDFLKAGDACRAIQQKLAETLVENPQNLGSGRLVFRTGFDKVLDQCVALLANGEEAIEAFEQRERQRTGISSLKVKHHKNFGYLIEITKSNIAKTPPDYHRRQTMVNNERFVCAELLDLGQELETADSRAQAREAELYELLLGDLSEHSEPVRNLALALADLDVFQSLALRAKKFGYIRPKFSSKGDVNLRASRHPVLEELLGQHCCVANDIALHDPIRQFLITGPNMAGKSTIMRQLALIAIMHQIGSYVPAAEAELPVFDRLFTRVGASDDLALGQSTFMIEMSEAACVLREATRRSLVILDEVGRGTSTDDGLAIAAAIFDDVIRRIGCVTLFATHYHELVPMTAEYPSVAPMQIEVIPTAEGVKFTHKFKVGAAGESFGIEVAKIAGIPTQVVQSALAHLQAFAQKRDTQPPSKVASVLPVPIVREATGAGDLRERLLRLNLDRLTPLKALILLGDWQQQARGIRGASRGQASLFPDQIS